ncbi:MAG: nucleotidyl transferase AbiEii/AbiGii toxin family protein [Verrucomicrobia bacterium]|nr:nucleotidyl transferase AbiEii/AbiGii toxin family protein [Verrucomicrobiota bacterium]
MMNVSAQVWIERFHLLFLRLLAQQLPGNLWALKGGCNLRFFYPSLRYSEDLDFDVQTIARETLQSKIQKILNKLQEAVAKAQQISHKDFVGQVVVYLEPAYQDHYRQSEVWANLLETVVQRLWREAGKQP